ncbi:hypothetical protein LCGC14_3030390, partial [marine sediment metagenome]
MDGRVASALGAFGFLRGDLMFSTLFERGLYHLARFTTTILNKVLIPGATIGGSFPEGLAWDDTNTIILTSNTFLYLLAGRFTTTVLTSKDLSTAGFGSGSDTEDISWTGSNTWVCGFDVSNRIISY